MTPDAIPAGRNAVVCITDRNYLLPTKVMLGSLLRVLSPDVRVFVLSKDVFADEFSDVEFRGRIDGIVDYSALPSFAELARAAFRGRTHVSGDAMAKLLLPFLFEGYERVLYLDVDMICCSPEINELFSLDLAGAMVAAVPDAKIANHSFREVLDLAPGHPYFNSGLVLFDILQCRKTLTERLVIDRATTIAPKVRFVDQDTLNYIYRNKVHYLDLRFNVFANVHMGGGRTLPLAEVSRVAGESFMAFPTAELARAMKERVVLHYTSSSKPWKTSCGSDDLWWQEYKALGLGTAPRRRAPKKAPWSRVLDRLRAFVRARKKALAEALGFEMLRRMREQLDAVSRDQRTLMAARVVSAPERVRVPVVLDLRWALRPEDLTEELARLFRDYAFDTKPVVLVASSFKETLEDLGRSFECPFAIDERDVADGLHFRTNLFGANGAALHAEYLQLRIGGSVASRSVGSWVEVRSGVARCLASSPPRGAELLKVFGAARYDDAISALYREAEGPASALG